MSLTKRNLLLALVALGVAPALAQESASLDLSAGRALGEAYRAANPQADFAAVQALTARGLSAETIAALRARVAADFSASRVFIHRGWRLSETEAQIFALLA